MVRSFFRAGVAPAALIALASTASATYSVDLGFDLEVWNFNSSGPTYNLFPSAFITGYSDESHPDNAYFITSPNSLYEGGPTGSGSSASDAPIGVLDEANAGFWSLTITDGLTGDIRTFEFEVFIDSALDDLDYWRITTITSHAQGDALDQNPTFEWSIDPAANPANEYDTITTILFGAAFDFAGLPGNATSWSPSIAPLNPGDVFSFAVTSYNSGNAPTEYVEITSGPSATDGLDELDFFGFNWSINSLAAVTDLTVVPAPGTLALAGIAGLVAIRRRR
jgi:hypothetical protein